jgi:hypothetical protein
LPDECPHFFVRGPESRGWVCQGDLTEEKSASMQARIDEHNRKVKEFRLNRQAAGRLIDIETCELFRMSACDDDPYDIKLAPYPQWGTNRFVRSQDSDGWIHEGDLPVEKGRAMYARIERECVAREKIIDDLFEVLRQGGGLMATRTAMNAAEKVYGVRIVKDALRDFNDPNMGAIGGLMIQRGYLTMEHVTELLRSDAARNTRSRPASRAQGVRGVLRTIGNEHGFGYLASIDVRL